jgi:hypothetical protein
VVLSWVTKIADIGQHLDNRGGKAAVLTLLTEQEKSCFLIAGIGYIVAAIELDHASCLYLEGF